MIFQNNLVIKGLNDTSFSHYIIETFENCDRNIVVITPTLFEANRLLNILTSYTDKALLFPMDDFLTSMAIAISPDLEITRLETMNSLLNKEKHILVTHLMGFLRFLPEKKLYQDRIIKITKNSEYDIKKLVEDLTNIGYKRDTIVSKTTDMAVRGYVVDIFPVSSINPIRIEYFGDEVDSIRYFDSETQKSIEEVNDIEIYPASEYLLENNDNLLNKQHLLSIYNKEVSSILDYLEDPLIFIKDYPQVKNLLKETKKQIEEYHDEEDKEYVGKYMHSLKILDNHEKVYYLSHDSILNDIDTENIIDYKIKEVPKFHENIEGITNYLQSKITSTIIICLKKYQIKSFTKNIDLDFVITDIEHIFLNKINIVELELEDCFIYKDFYIINYKDLI